MFFQLWKLLNFIKRSFSKEKDLIKQPYNLKKYPKVSKTEKVEVAKNVKKKEVLLDLFPKMKIMGTILITITYVGYLVPNYYANFSNHCIFEFSIKFGTIQLDGE
jgi:hypothetical protein